MALPDLRQLGDRGAGEIVVDHRTSWVRRLPTDGETVFVKTYEYATWGARWRNLARWTAPWRPSRAGREVAAMQWLSHNGFATCQPLLVVEWRRWGFLERATLVTRAYDGVPADALLPELPASKRDEATTAIRAFVTQLHTAGFRDRNLDLRNLLLRRDQSGWTIAKIDSPRFRLVAAGATDDALAKADWARLRPQLAPFEGRESNRN